MNYVFGSLFPRMDVQMRALGNVGLDFAVEARIMGLPQGGNIMKRFFGIVLMAFAVSLSVGCSSNKGKKPQEQPVRDPQTTTRIAPRHPVKHHPKDVSKPKKMTRPTKVTTGMFRPMVPGRRVARVSVPGKYVALTFDDGPSASYTPKVLDILRRHGVHATFFVLGENAARNKGILARAAAEGHEIASHTWDHANLTKLTHAQIASQMDRTASVIREATGSAPALMRPPYGATDRSIVDYMMTQYGTPSVLWDVDTVDWKHPGVNVVINRAVQQARNGSIILLHDIHASTLQAVEGVVEGLLARGFKLVTVSQLLRMARSAANAPAQEPARLSGTAAVAPTIASTPPPSDEDTGTPTTPEQKSAGPEQPKQPETPSPAEPQQAEGPVDAPPASETTDPPQMVEPSSPAPETESNPTESKSIGETEQQTQPGTE